VGVIDTGIDYNHEDIAANIWTNNAELNGLPGKDDDGNGYIDDIRGWDFSGNDYTDNPSLIKSDNNPMDYYGHGAHVAGTIAAIGNNSKGIIGVAPKSKVMAVKMFPNAYMDIAVKSMKYAVDNGAKILNCSWGPSGRTTSIPILQEMIDFVHSSGCLPIFAAGNNSDDVVYYFPAGYSKIITVSATDHNDQWAMYSNGGFGIDVSAPGGDDYAASDSKRTYDNILSLRASGTDGYGDGINIVNDRYYRARGTSMACPHVAGVAALIKAKNPSFGPEDIRRVLYISADDKNKEGFDILYGFGRVNAYKALRADSLSYLCARIRKPVSNTQFGRLVQISGTVLASNFSRYAIEAGQGRQPSSWTTRGISITNNGNSQITEGILGRWDSSSFADGTYSIRLRVFNSSGIFREMMIPVIVNNLIEIGWPQRMDMGASDIGLGSPVLADIDNDGDLEVMASSWDGQLWVWH
ncbi:MAG: S8 family serine peptidase, partial [Candidatus Omnitrophota bacterium]|nr:S8 family serine peptidase [Candidatus Omnitrophota bacterium]